MNQITDIINFVNHTVEVSSAICMSMVRLCMFLEFKKDIDGAMFTTALRIKVDIKKAEQCT